ncbi:MAG: hypothetical protein HZB57_00755 [Gammaproteobacteria bacterium]|nr:hypothetical protein [Gammaproteobacteria bacterium]
MALLPLAWQQRSRLLFRMALLTVVYALLVALLDRPDRRVFIDCMLIAFTLVAISPAIRRSVFPIVADIPRDIGYAGYLVVLVMLAFREGARLLHWVSAQGSNHDAIHNVYFYALAGMALLAAFAALRTVAQARPVARVNFAILLLTTLFAVLASEGVWVTSYALWVWANVAALTHAVLWIIDGAHNQQSRKVTLACLLFAAIAIPRFLDLFDSLLMRSLLFLALGAGLFLVGNFYQRHKPSVASATEVSA